MAKIVVTTSRRPSPRTRSFVKDLVSVLPGALRVTRGHLTMDELGVLASSHGADRLVVVGERKGNPSIIRVYEVSPPTTPRNIVTFKIVGLSLARELRRGVPQETKFLYVDVEDEELLDFAEAFILAFHAKLKYPGARTPRDSLIALITPLREAIALVEFSKPDGTKVGPKLKLARPKEMIKKSVYGQGSSY